MKMNTTKSKLLSSLLVLALCVTMFAGSTYAWFTDSVTSAYNIIKSGTLKVGMEWAEGKEDPATTTAWTDASSGAIFNNDLWEPGYTEARHIKISNKGSLGLKYQLNITATGEVSKLAEVIDVYFADPAAKMTDRNATADMKYVGTLKDVLSAGVPAATYGEIKAGEGADVVTIALKMRESADNNYQNLSIGSSFEVKLLATQLTAEEDAFDDKYDNGAYLFEVETAEQLVSALEAGGGVKLAKDITLNDQFVVPAGASVTIDLNGKTLTGNIANVDGSNVIISDGTINAVNPNSSAIETTGNLTLNNVEISSNRHAVRVEGGQTIINGGTYKAAGYAGRTQHAVNVSDGGVVIINDGTFVGPAGTVSDSGSAVNVGAGSTVTINGGDFSGGKSKTLAGSGTLVVKGGTFDQDPSAYVASGYAATNDNGTWTVAFDGRTVGSAEELVSALASGGNIMLTNDISYDAAIVIPEGASLIGNGYTITYSVEDDCHLVKLSNGAKLENVTLENYRVRTESTTNGMVTLTNVTINMDNDLTGLDISRGAGTAKLTNVTCKGITDAAHLDPNTQVQVDYTPYGDVLLGTKWGLEATDCIFGSLHGWNATNNGSNVSLNNTTATVFRMHYWPNRTLYINGVETTWADSGAIPVAHDVGGCWSVQPAFR